MGVGVHRGSAVAGGLDTAPSTDVDVVDSRRFHRRCCSHSSMAFYAHIRAVIDAVHVLCEVVDNFTYACETLGCAGLRRSLDQGA